MKYLHASTLFAALALLASGALAQKAMGSMDNMDMSNMGNMGNMGTMMGNMDNMGSMTMGKKPHAESKAASHKASGTVKKLDQKTGVVTLSHGPVATLNWPAMTMSFKVRDKALLPKLAEGSKVNVELIKDGDDYVVTSVK